jgi:hypothetical protein
MALITLVTSLLAVSSAEAKPYRLINCRVNRGQNHYAVTSFGPGCGFGKVAYQSLLSLARTGARHGSVAVQYQRKRYKLGCALTNYGLLLECGVGGKPYVRLYLDSAYAPAGYHWPTHTRADRLLRQRPTVRSLRAGSTLILPSVHLVDAS